MHAKLAIKNKEQQQQQDSLGPLLYSSQTVQYVPGIG